MLESACSSRSASPTIASRLGQSTPTSTPVAPRQRRGHLLQQRLDLHGAEARQLVAGARPGEHEQRPGQPRQPARLAFDHAEELVARRRLVLGAGLQHLDGGDDRGERRAELVGGVGRELALHALVARALGLVLDDEDRVLAARRRRDAGDEERAVVVDQADVARTARS